MIPDSKINDVINKRPIGILCSGDTISMIERCDVIEKIYVNDERVLVWSLPDIDEVCYGRDVGWGMRRIYHDKENISGTNIRGDNE